MLKNGVHIIGGCAAVAKHWRTCRCQCMPWCRPCEFLAHQRKYRREMGEKILRRRLKRTIHLKSEPAAKGLRDKVRKAVTRDNRGDRLAERRRNIPCKRHRPECGTSDAGDCDGMQAGTLGAIRV